MKILNLSVGAMIMRLYLMGAIMVAMGFLGFMYTGIVICMVFFLATFLGVKFSDINPFKRKKEIQYEWDHKHHPAHHVRN